MRMESALRGGAEITVESVNILGRFSYAHMKKNDTGQMTAKRTINCYNCGNQVTGQIMKNKEICPELNVKCNKCGKGGHFAKVCKSSEDIRQVEPEKGGKMMEYTINVPRLSSRMRHKQIETNLPYTLRFLILNQLL
jgi:hypothetical protein